MMGFQNLKYIADAIKKKWFQMRVDLKCLRVFVRNYVIEKELKEGEKKNGCEEGRKKNKMMHKNWLLASELKLEGEHKVFQL